MGFTVVADPERLNLVVEYTLDFCRRMLRLLEMPLLGPVVRRFVKGADRYRLTFHRLIDEYEQHGRDRVLRGATALILFTRRSETGSAQSTANWPIRTVR